MKKLLMLSRVFWLAFACWLLWLAVREMIWPGSASQNLINVSSLTALTLAIIAHRRLDRIEHGR